MTSPTQQQSTDYECFACEWFGDDPAHPFHDPDDVHCPECGARLTTSES